MNALNIYRIGRYFYQKRLILISRIFDYLNYFFHNSYIPSSCAIGKDCKIAYGGIGVVIHANVKIGNHCMIGQGITIGGKSGEKNVPIIHDNVYIGAGARVLGEIIIGHDCIIGANSVVVHDIEPYSVVIGIPARALCKITSNNFDKKYKYYFGPLNCLEND